VSREPAGFSDGAGNCLGSEGLALGEVAPPLPGRRLPVLERFEGILGPPVSGTAVHTSQEEWVFFFRISSERGEPPPLEVDFRRHMIVTISETAYRRGDTLRITDVTTQGDTLHVRSRYTRVGMECPELEPAGLYSIVIVEAQRLENARFYLEHFDGPPCIEPGQDVTGTIDEQQRVDSPQPDR